MSEEQLENEQKTQPNETGGFRFAVTLLAASGTVFYSGYTYLQNTPIDPLWYGFVCGLIAVALILVGGLILYILIKGYSLEVKDSDQKEKFKNWASNIYSMIFLMFIMLLVFVLCLFVLVLLKIKIASFLFSVIFLISLMVGLVFVGIPFRKKLSKSKSIDIVTIALMVGAFVWVSLFVAVLCSPLHGHVTVDMESIYYKNNAPIPVLIHLTGPNTGLSIALVKEESNHNLSKIDSIMLKPEQNPDKTESGKYLLGNALKYGTYIVFINATNLSAGYYELRYERAVYKSQGGLKKETHGARGFYLLNSSQQSYIGEINGFLIKTR